MKATATAPCRADLAGGTLDIWPLGVLQPHAMTVNAAIPVKVRLEVERDGEDGEVIHGFAGQSDRLLTIGDESRDLTAAVCFALQSAGGLRVRVLEQAPVGSGLGGSSSYAVALARAVLALEDREMNDRSLVALLRDLEARIMGTRLESRIIGRAVRGGVLAIGLEPGGETIERIGVPSEWLDHRLSIFYTGITHHSGMVNWQVIRRRIEGDQTTIAAFAEIADCAASCRRGLIARDESGCGMAIAAEWRARKRLAPEVCPFELERLETIAMAAGAVAVKACGAGGGGSLLLWHPPAAREDLNEALAAAAPAGKMFPAGIVDQGCQVVVT